MLEVQIFNVDSDAIIIVLDASANKNLTIIQLKNWLNFTKDINELASSFKWSELFIFMNKKDLLDSEKEYDFSEINTICEVYYGSPGQPSTRVLDFKS